jgi:hypothetical protein
MTARIGSEGVSFVPLGLSLEGCSFTSSAGQRCSRFTVARSVTILAIERFRRDESVHLAAEEVDDNMHDARLSVTLEHSGLEPIEWPWPLTMRTVMAPILTRGTWIGIGSSAPLTNYRLVRT